MQVVIPAAGMGKRLGELTSDKTKCMVQVNGKTLIEQCLDIVTSFKISRIILIVGHEEKKLKELIGSNYNNIEVIYIQNKEYKTTNNIFSIYLARKFFKIEDTILIESDLIFEKKVLKKVIESRFKDLAVVDKYQSWMDGTAVRIDTTGSIDNFISKSEFNFEEIDCYFKTVNIYKLSRDFSRKIFVPFLEAYSKAIGKNEYYEQVLKVLVDIKMGQLKALTLKDEKWFEIDDLQDLENAEVIFSSSKKKYDLLNSRYGGYWRFTNIKDFCYLVNPYFPTDRMKNELRHNFDSLINSYPSGEKTQSFLASNIFNIPPEYIAVGNGAAELLDILGRNLELKLSIFSPTFEEYVSRFKNLDIHFPKKKYFRYSKEDVIRISKNNDGVILVNPDNPSGNFINYKEIISILKIFKREKKYLILDESFLDFADNAFKSSALNKVDLEKYNNLIIIKSIGKSFGVGGIRLGVIASSDERLMALIKKEIPIWNVNSIAENYMQILNKYMNDYRRSCEKIIERRNDLFKDLKKISYIVPYPSQANYILFEVKKIKASKLAESLCNKFGIYVKDCSNKLGLDTKNLIRVAIRDETDNKCLIEALKTFE
tara:strand:+ start:13856 stop:15652 length:1797 start_codon:yes stop_codon:yes gene_type:complete